MMTFYLFSKIGFEINDPVSLIEYCCFQNDFYGNYDLILKERKRKINDTNKIGARISAEKITKCEAIIKTTAMEMVNFLQYDLDKFLNLPAEVKESYIQELYEKIFSKFLNIVGFSQATKILHTLYPEIMPIIDNPLQELYRKEVRVGWKQEVIPILSDYFENFRYRENMEQVNEIHKILSSRGIALTKIRVFDILWWSFLKSQASASKCAICWDSIKRV
jgi:hypothetical protein